MSFVKQPISQVSLRRGSVNNALLESSHELRLKRTELPRAAIAESLVRVLGVVRGDPLSDGRASVGKLSKFAEARRYGRGCAGIERVSQL